MTNPKEVTRIDLTQSAIGNKVDVKKLQSWLAKAIAYLEQEKK